ncbi:NUDIX domain-containing protein [Microbacterium gorillae]|uniref:NUDIX domain-containing protein n=1 Tax=Microbacterium gorillae TaxID=1231063 RepID=UPI000590734A|nr:NUDIX domain-containing protein [Microbacterium gorillae]
MSHIRPIAVGLPVREDRVLALEGYDRVRDLRFLRAIGGGIEFGETADEAVRREFTEELGVELTGTTQLSVAENIFTYEGVDGHEIAFIFTVDSSEIDAIPLDAELEVLDEGSPIRWFPIAEIRSGALPLFPTGAAEVLERLTP